MSTRRRNRTTENSSQKSQRLCDDSIDTDHDKDDSGGDAADHPPMIEAAAVAAMVTTTNSDATATAIEDTSVAVTAATAATSIGTNPIFPFSFLVPNQQVRPSQASLPQRQEDDNGNNLTNDSSKEKDNKEDDADVDVDDSNDVKDHEGRSVVVVKPEEVSSAPTMLPAMTTDPMTMTLFRLKSPVLLTVPGKCSVATSFPKPTGDFEIPVTNGTHWLRLDWDEPVLVTRLSIAWKKLVILYFTIQVPDSDAPERWENLLSVSSSNAVPDKFDDAETHNVDLPLTKPIVALRLVIRNIKNAPKNTVCSIAVHGYTSTIAGIPIVLSTPVELTGNPRAVRLASSDEGLPNLGIDNILNDSADFQNGRWAVPVYSSRGNLWVTLDFESPVLLEKCR